MLEYLQVDYTKVNFASIAERKYCLSQRSQGEIARQGESQVPMFASTGLSPPGGPTPFQVMFSSGPSSISSFWGTSHSPLTGPAVSRALRAEHPRPSSSVVCVPADIQVCPMTLAF